MFCSKCGVKAVDGAIFCTQCGASIDNDGEINKAVNLSKTLDLIKTTDTDKFINNNELIGKLEDFKNLSHIDENQELQQSEYKQLGDNFADKDKISFSHEKEGLIPLVMVLCIVAIGSVSAIFYMLNKTYIKPVTTYSNVQEIPKADQIDKVQKSDEAIKSTPIESSTLSSSTSNVQLDNENVENPTYLTYNDSFLKLSCAYPSHFVKTENVKAEDRLLLKSPNKIANMSICVIQNNSTLSAKAVMQQYINSMGGNIEYQANGDTWYATSITVGDMWYYRKCFVHNDYISWFDFNYPIRYNDMYQKYINYIEDNFKVQQSN